jgi:hypothetical protein
MSEKWTVGGGVLKQPLPTVLVPDMDSEPIRGRAWEPGLDASISAP